MWIARDYDGALYLFDREPKLDEGVYYESGNYMELDKNLFPELHHEDGPKEVTLLIKH